MKKLMLGLVMVFVVTAEATVTIDGLTYELNTQDKTATLVGFTVSPAEIDVSTIESGTETYTVTSVGGFAVNRCENLTSVSLPNAIEIGEAAFDDCTALEKVIVKNRAMKTELENNRSYYGLGDGVKIVNGSIVKTYILNDDLTAELESDGMLTIIGSGAMPDWDYFLNQAWYDESDQIKSVVAEGVTAVGRYAFWYCLNLTNISFSTAISVGESAFDGCKNLTSVSMPNATLIGQYAFYGCTSLLEISLPSAAEIERSAFAACSKLPEISLPNATEIGESAFEGCSELSEILLPSAAGIGEAAFMDCANLSEISLPNADAFGICVFEGCSALEKVIVKNCAVKAELENNRSHYGLGDDVIIMYPPALTDDQVRQATWGGALMTGPLAISAADYCNACVWYDVTPKAEPPIVHEDEIAVKKEAIRAPHAETVEVEGNAVRLGVVILKTSDLTDETKGWDKVKITKADIDVDADGNIIVNVPVDSASGFMILQSGDAKIAPAGK